MFLLALETALRSIRKTPGVSMLVVFTIGIGIGVLMPMMAVRDVYSDDPLADRSDRLYRVLIDNWRKDEPYWNQWPDLPPVSLTALDVRALTTSRIPTRQAPMYVSQQYVRPYGSRNEVRPQYTQVRVTRRDFFGMFGAPFAFGAAWDVTAEENATNVAVINKVTNERLFGGGDSTGSELWIGEEIYTIVGVLGAWEVIPRVWDLSTLSAPIEGVFVPLSGFSRNRLAPIFWVSLERESIIASFGQAVLNSEVLFASLWVQLDAPDQIAEYRAFLDRHWRNQNSLGRFEKPMNNRLYSAAQWVHEAPFLRNVFTWYGALIAVGFLFLTVCVLNSLSLLLSKFLSATQEISVTRALGASKALIFVQHVLEVGMLGAAGGMLGIGIARLALIGMYKFIFIPNLPREMVQVIAHADDPYAYFAMDASMLVTAIGISIVAAVIAAVYPAWRACRIPPAEYLKIN